MKAALKARSPSGKRNRRGSAGTEHLRNKAGRGDVWYDTENLDVNVQGSDDLSRERPYTPTSIRVDTGSPGVSSSGATGQEWREHWGQPTVKEEVDAFLLSLPLGTSAKDAAIEEHIEKYLLTLLEERATMQSKLEEWADATTELEAVISEQHDELEALREAAEHPTSAAVLASPPACGENLAFERSFVHQQHEILELKTLIRSLREDLRGNELAYGHPAYDAILSRLSTSQQQLGALHAAHEMAFKHQEGLHSQELERLVQQIQKLEAMVVGREAEAVQRSQDQERMHRLHPAAEEAKIGSQDAKGKFGEDGETAHVPMLPHLQATEDDLARAPQKEYRDQSQQTNDTADEATERADEDEPEAPQTSVPTAAARAQALIDKVDALGAERLQLELQMRQLRGELEAAQLAAGADREAHSEQVAALEAQLELQRDLETAIVEDLHAANVKLETQHVQYQELESSLLATLERLKGCSAATSNWHHQLDSAKSAAETQAEALTEEMSGIKALAAAECTRLRSVAEEAEARAEQIKLAAEEHLVLALAKHQQEMEALRVQCAASCAELQACHQAEIMGLQQAAETLRAEAAARAEAQLTQEAELQKQVQASFEAGVTFARRSPGDSAALETEAAALRQQVEDARLAAADNAARAQEVAVTLRQQLQSCEAERATLAAQLQTLQQGAVQRSAATQTSREASAPPTQAPQLSPRCEAGAPTKRPTKVAPSPFAALEVQHASEGTKGAARAPSRSPAEREPETKTAAAEECQQEARGVAPLSSGQLHRSHVKELESVRAAFEARAAAMHDDLEAKAALIEQLQPALWEAEERLHESSQRLERSEAALGDCQEMLEELQAFSEAQERQICDLQTALQTAQEGRQGLQTDLEDARAAAERDRLRLETLTQQVEALEQQRQAQLARADCLAAERERLSAELERVSRQPADSSEADKVQLAGLTEAMEAGKQEHAARLDMLAGQIGEEARRRAQAEAKALALYQAHTQAQARAQEQSEALLRKVFEQEKAIRQLLERHPDFTPGRRATMLNALSDSSLNRAPAGPSSPAPRAIEFGRENPPTVTSVASTSPPPGSPGSAFKHLHFNPVFKDRSPGRAQKSHSARKPIAGGSSPAKPAASTSPNRWVKVGEMPGLPQWRRDDDAQDF